MTDQYPMRLALHPIDGQTSGNVSRGEASKQAKRFRPENDVTVPDATSLDSGRAEACKKRVKQQQQNQQQNVVPPSYIPAQRSDDLFAAERAIVKTFDPLSGEWGEKELQIQICRRPFSDGSMRAAYKMKVLSGMDVHGNDRQWVVKLSKDPKEDPRQYARDVEMQMEAGMWAQQFNKLGVPKKVHFLEAFVAVLPDRSASPTCLIERFVEGKYEKYNDNWDWSDDRRNTPQAFSHWSWEASGHRQLICDLQGVDDVWTDPQIHTIDGVGYGRGNAGLQGVRKFFLKHTCNSLCNALGLKTVTGRVKGDNDHGTQWQGLKEAQRKHAAELMSASVGMTVDGGAGLGITLPLLVVSVHAGGPASVAGVQRGDVVVAVDGENVHGLNAEQVKRLMSGRAGTQVKILLKSGNRNVSVTLTRTEEREQANSSSNHIPPPRVARRGGMSGPAQPPPRLQAPSQAPAFMQRMGGAVSVSEMVQRWGGQHPRTERAGDLGRPQSVREEEEEEEEASQSHKKVRLPEWIAPAPPVPAFSIPPQNQHNRWLGRTGSSGNPPHDMRTGAGPVPPPRRRKM